MFEANACLLGASTMAVAVATWGLMFGGLSLFVSTVIQACRTLRRAPDGVEPRVRIGIGAVILLALLGLWVAAGGLAWRLYDERLMAP